MSYPGQPNQSEDDKRKRAQQLAFTKSVDDLLARAQANAQPKAPTVTSTDKSGKTEQRNDLYIGVAGSKQADLAIGERQLATGSGVAGKHRDEYLKTTEGAGIKGRLFQEGIKVRPHTREGALEAAENVEAAKQEYYRQEAKNSGPIRAGQRDPITGQRITSATGQRPKEPNANDLAKIIGANPNLTSNQKEYAVNSLNSGGSKTTMYGTTIVGSDKSNEYVSTPRGALSDSLRGFIAEQEKAGDLYYTGKARITDEGYEFQFGSKAESKKYKDALKAFNVDNYNYRQEKARVDAANAKSEADYQKFLSDAYDQGYRGKLISIDDKGVQHTSFAAFSKDGKLYYPDANGVFNIPAEPEKEKPYTPTQSGQIFAGSVKYFGEIGAGLTVLGGGVVSKAADLLGLKDQAKGVHEATEAAAGAIKEATGFGTLEKFYDNLARVTGNDNYYVEAGEAKRAKEALEQKDRPTGSLFGSGIAIAATGFEKAGLPGDKQAAESLRQDQLDSVTNRQTEYGVASAWDVVTFGGAGVLSDIGKSAGNAVKGIGKSASKGFVREAETAASRAGIEGKVATRPVQQVKIKSTGEIVDVPLQPTKVGNFAWSNKLVRIPKIGGKEIKIGIMEDYPIATVKVPEGVSTKRLVHNPVREVVDERGDVVGAVSPKSGKVIIQRQDAIIDVSGSSGKNSRSVDIGNLVGQDATKTQDTMAWLKKQTDLTSIKEEGTKPFYHSSKIIQRIEKFAIDHDPTLNVKAKRLKGKLDVEYEKADKLQARKAELQQELSLANQDVSRLSVSDMMGVESVDTEGLQSAIARKEAASKKLYDIDIELGKSRENIRLINARYGIKRHDAIGAFQHANEYFYKVGGRGRDKQTKGLLGFNAGGPPIPPVKDLPNRSGELRAKSTTDIYRLEENPSLPSSRRSKLEAFDLLRDGEGIDPTGEYFIKKSGAATKLKSDLAAVDIEFGLGDVKKSIRQTDKRNKQIEEANEALSLLGGSSKKSTPFKFNILDDMPGQSKPRGSSNSIIEVVKAKEPETFASVKESVYSAEREASFSGLGLGGNAKNYTAIGSLGFGGETGASRRKKTVTEDSLAYLRYPGEKLSLKDKPTIGLEEFVGRTLLHDSGSGGGVAKPKRSVPTFDELTGLGGKSKQDDKMGLGDIFKIDTKPQDTFKFDQGSGLDYSFKLDQITKQLNKPQRPDTIQKSQKPFGLPFLGLPGMGFGSGGGKPAGKDSLKRNHVEDLFLNHAFDVNADVDKGNRSSKGGNKDPFGIFGSGKRKGGRKKKRGALF